VIVVGVLVPSASGSPGSPGSPATGSVVEIARRAAATGARTEIVGVAPPGPAGDRLLGQLAAAGVGHATITRSDAPGIEPADLDLALRYLPDVHAIVLVAPAAPLLATAIAAAGWSGATLLVVGPLDADAAATLDADTSSTLDGASLAPGRPAAPIVLDPPARDPDAAFAGLVAVLAAHLDAGDDPAAAWRSTLASLAVDPA
jgi:hypothetical protein